MCGNQDPNSFFFFLNKCSACGPLNDSGVGRNVSDRRKNTKKDKVSFIVPYSLNCRTCGKQGSFDNPVDIS